MEDFSSPGDWEKLEIICPRCSSTNVTLELDEFGYYRVTLCHKCGYRYLEGAAVEV